MVGCPWTWCESLSRTSWTMSLCEKVRYGGESVLLTFFGNQAINICVNELLTRMHAMAATGRSSNPERC